MSRLSPLIIAVAILASTRWVTSNPITLHHTGTASANTTTLPTPTGTPTLTTLHTITVEGNGELTGEPDTIHLPITLSLHDEVPTSKEAMDIINKDMESVLALLKKYKIPEKDIQTASLQLRQQYEYQNNQRMPTGYMASQKLNTKISLKNNKIDQVEDLIDELASIKNIELNGFTFDIDDKDPIVTLARAQAFEKAKIKAEELAALAGKELGDAISINEAYATAPVVYQEMKVESAMMDSRGAPAPTTNIQTGELTVTANLTIVFTIKD